MSTMDRVFDSMYRVLPKRQVTFTEATAWNEDTESPVYAQPRALNAKILDRPRLFDEARGAYIVVDGLFLTVWFRDWFQRTNDVATVDELLALETSLKGLVRETDGTFYSRFLVDGKALQYQSHSFLNRPDGQLYAVRLTLQAA